MPRLATPSLAEVYQLQPVPPQFNQKTWSQSLEFVGQGRWLTQIEFDQQQMVLIAVTPSGLPLLQLTWSAKNGLQVIQKPPFELDLMQIIRDIQWVHWPRTQLEAGFAQQINLQQEQAENVKIKRTIKQGQQVLVEIHYTGQDIRLHNHQQAYQLVITKL